MQHENQITRGKVKKVFSDIFGSRSGTSRLLHLYGLLSKLGRDII